MNWYWEQWCKLTPGEMFGILLFAGGPLFVAIYAVATTL